jgi:hypothetical protein
MKSRKASLIFYTKTSLPYQKAYIKICGWYRLFLSRRQKGYDLAVLGNNQWPHSSLEIKNQLPCLAFLRSFYSLISSLFLCPFFIYMVDSKYIGLILALCSSLLIGTSFVITKKGLQKSKTANGQCFHFLSYFLALHLASYHGCHVFIQISNIL